MNTVVKRVMIGLIVVGIIAVTCVMLSKNSAKDSYVDNNDNSAATTEVTDVKSQVSDENTEVKSTEKKTEESKATEKKTEESTERSTQVTNSADNTRQTSTRESNNNQRNHTQSTSTTSQRSTQASTERSTQSTTQRNTQASTERSTQTSTERSTQATTQHQHDWQPIVETDTHIFCSTCHMDLTAAGVSTDAHDEASGTYPVNVGGTIMNFYNCAGSYSGSVQVVIGYRCPDCGATK